MDEQIAQLDRRLTIVEAEVAAASASARAHYATKEDIARIEARVSVIQSNYATKEDLAILDNKQSVENAALSNKLSAETAALNNKLSTETAALKVQIAQLESSMIRWSIVTILAVSGIVVSAVKIWP